MRRLFKFCQLPKCCAADFSIRKILNIIEDLVILVNGESINVIVKGEDLKEEEIAQIQNIVTRELGAKIENIHIMNKT